jgi:hypothetical protein
VAQIKARLAGRSGALAKGMLEALKRTYFVARLIEYTMNSSYLMGKEVTN